ncbi:hypothetical protein Vadar_006858 [Vaccinium darrowii]|uniref:Uncharacterized protein n=2 Tax=Vaccinium darrowii TaxID=229202 RepID=A0ACB7Z2C5_9ERIC|nr:hypothetical protein Vadar_003759 [Vaccinium darrowii]KAH7859897.1 hypothetical protein Vadar_006858 [Vaccinium darrowii]
MAADLNFKSSVLMEPWRRWWIGGDGGSCSFLCAPIAYMCPMIILAAVRMKFLENISALGYNSHYGYTSVSNSNVPLKPDVVFFDFAYWLPGLARRLGIKSVHYCTISPATLGYSMSPARTLNGREVTEGDLMLPLPDYPDLSIKLRPHEARIFYVMRSMKHGGDLFFYDRLQLSTTQCDALGLRTCREIEGPFCDYMGRQFGIREACPAFETNYSRATHLPFRPKVG